MKNGFGHLYHVVIITMAIYLPACIHKSQIDKHKLYLNRTINKFIKTSDTPPPVTIWVHGTLVFRTPTYHHIFNKKSSLVRAITLPYNNHFRILAEAIAENDPEQFPLEEFYIFSWSGRLANKERKEAAEKLYQEIILLCQEYQKVYGCQPIIRIITHSHGGNVVLNMVPLNDNAKIAPIASLILLACPVQDETMHFIDTPLFEHVYSLYSSFDIVQILAPQFKRPRINNCSDPTYKPRRTIFPFSARLFPHYTNLVQVKIKLNNYPISHTAFTRKKFVALIPGILNKLDNWHSQNNQKNDQQHKLLCIYTQ